MPGKSSARSAPWAGMGKAAGMKMNGIRMA
jgi:hypothetical protein